MSNVYVVGHQQTGSGAIDYGAGCDTAIISGVIAILLKLYSGNSPSAVLDVDADDLFTRLDLFNHLSPTRHVGVYAIVERIRTIAREFGPAIPE